MNQWPWKYILISLCIGMLAGAAGGLGGAKRMSHQWKDRGSERLAKRFDHQLNLTPAQHAQVLTLLNTYRNKMEGHRQEVRLAVRSEIRTLLTPDQQARFDAMEARRDAKRHKRRGF